MRPSHDVGRYGAMTSRRSRSPGSATWAMLARCALDPDADILRDVIATGRSRTDPAWACYHTELHVVVAEDASFGLIGGVIGASCAVLVAEELFASGCEVLLSITSAGQIRRVGTPPYFILIDRAIRDEGTSYHYPPPARYAEADPNVLDAAARALTANGLAVDGAAPGRPTHPFARRPRPSPVVAMREFSRSRWRRRRFTRSRTPAVNGCSASPT